MTVNERTSRIMYTFSNVKMTSTIAGVIAPELARMGKRLEVVLNGVEFVVYYDERGATGDNGQPVRGCKVGDYEVVYGDRVIFNQHVSPHGGRWGNPRAKSYSAERVAEVIANRAARAS